MVHWKGSKPANKSYKDLDSLSSMLDKFQMGLQMFASRNADLRQSEIYPQLGCVLWLSKLPPCIPHLSSSNSPIQDQKVECWTLLNLQAALGWNWQLIHSYINLMITKENVMKSMEN